MTETASCELLEWDSEHFGFPIAQVIDSTLTARSADAIDDWCSDQGIRCVYLLADPADPETARVAAAHGYRVVDVRVSRRRSLEGVDELPVGGPEDLSFREATEADRDYLLALAARSHDGTRFYSDGGFSRERCDALYQAWMERGLRDSERVVRVAVVDGEPAGYHQIALPGPDGEGRGELLAVDERHRRKGISQALYVSTLQFFAARGALAQRVVMSGRNLTALRGHERLGFLTEKLEVWHHKWYGGATIG